MFTLFILALAQLGCEGEPNKGSGINRGARLAKLEGKLTFLGSNSNAKVSMMAGNKQIAGKFDPNTKKFTFDTIPPGPKALVVQKGGKTFNMKFPKTKKEGQSGKLSSVIPDTNAKGNGVFDLGRLELKQDPNGGGQFFLPQSNPLTAFDTDGDSLDDLNDEDVDGDGKLNWEDNAPWGEWEGDDAWMNDWSWEEECADAWGSECNWEGEEWINWEEIEESDFGFDENYGFEEYCAEFSSDPICAEGAGGWEWTEYCAQQGVGDPSCWAEDDFCAEFSDDPICGEDWSYSFDNAGDLCAEFPNDPFCAGGDDFCGFYPEDPFCAGGGDDPCLLDPSMPGCDEEDDYCVMNPEDPECSAGEGFYLCLDEMNGDFEACCAQHPDAVECMSGF
ncbi:hypothetical protein KKF91_20835 [Myxococcota bacterium]|nr:hypothetical protein [Myxococcota bacterium]MBU1432993.1 hypothetical protein [Myxococcota bacterium]MBU1897768.1 hypothetical protein [Myxococcota bacterium]